MITRAESQVGQVPKLTKSKANVRVFVGRLLECLRTDIESSVDQLSTQIQLDYHWILIGLYHLITNFILDSGGPTSIRLPSGGLA